MSQPPLGQEFTRNKPGETGMDIRFLVTATASLLRGWGERQQSGCSSPPSSHQQHTHNCSVRTAAASCPFYTISRDSRSRAKRRQVHPVSVGWDWPLQSKDNCWLGAALRGHHPPLRCYKSNCGAQTLLLGEDRGPGKQMSVTWVDVTVRTVRSLQG